MVNTEGAVVGTEVERKPAEEVVLNIEEWVRTQLARGSDPDQLKKILIARGYDPTMVDTILKQRRGAAQKIKLAVPQALRPYMKYVYYTVALLFGLAFGAAAGAGGGLAALSIWVFASQAILAALIYYALEGRTANKKIIFATALLAIFAFAVAIGSLFA